MKKTYILLVLITLFCKGFSQTDIYSGSVSGNWTSINSPYLIHGDISIPNNSTLSIESGVLIEFQGDYRLNVFGRLLANGMPNDTIIFTINDTTGFSEINQNGGWSGIYFLNIQASNDTSEINYSKISYCKRTSFANAQLGGGVTVINSPKVKITHSLIENNFVVYSGAGIYCEDSPIIIKFNTIRNNQCYSSNSYYGGAGIYCLNSNAIVTNNNINNNISQESGGGIYCRNSSMLIKDNIIRNNSAYTLSYSFGGGGIFCDYFSTPTISNNTIYQNSSQSGGGIMIGNNSNPLIEKNYIHHNYATYGGGILVHDNTLAQIKLNTIKNNIANMDGGGISSYSPGVCVNNLIVNNTAENGDGGGIYCHLFSLDVFNNTIAYNLAGDDGGGVYFFQCNTPTATSSTIKNTIIWGNISSDSNTFQIGTPSSDPIISFCDIEDNFTYPIPNFYINNVIKSNPQFINPPNIAGQDSLNLTYNFSISPSSPCINQGDTSSVTITSVDISGNVRIYDDIIDIGAYESDSIANIEEPNLLEEVLIYPNPTSCNFSISEENVNHIEVFNNLGQSLLRITNSDNINFCNQPTGIYFIRITKGEQSITRKLIKQ